LLLRRLLRWGIATAAAAAAAFAIAFACEKGVEKHVFCVLLCVARVGVTAPACLLCRPTHKPAHFDSPDIILS
jgi:hypothetical protein